MDVMEERERNIGRERLLKTLNELAKKLVNDPQIMAYLDKREHGESVHLDDLLTLKVFCGKGE